MKKKGKISIVSVDDHPIISDGIKHLIDRTEDIEFRGSATCPDELFRILSGEKTDLIIMDIELKGASGLDLLKAVNQRYSGIHVLVMSMHDEMIYGERSMKAGAKGYITKEAASKNLIEAIRAIMSGGIYISEQLQKQIVNKALMRSGSGGVSFECLSNREFEIFQLLGNGFSAKEISNKLNVSVNTIESHRKRIKNKLNMSSSSELTRQAVQWIIMSSRNSAGLQSIL